MNAPLPPSKRSERLYIRLTVDEAEYVAGLADMCGLSVSDYVRKRVLRGSACRSLVRRRVLPTDAAGTIRELSAIACDLRHLVALAEANKAIAADHLTTCLAAVHTALDGFSI